MKKIYFLLTLLIATSSFGQLTENFDASTTMPTGWAVFRGADGNGAGFDWVVTAPPENVGPTTNNAKGRYFSAPNCAFVRFEAGSLNEDWLVTPVVNLTNYTAASLTFYAGQQYSAAYGTEYIVKVSTSSQTDISTFVDLASYGEADLAGFGNSPASNLTDQKTISLAAYSGQQIYLAFVMVQDDGDNWSLDNVAVTGTLGTSTFDNENKINVFPNPTKGLLTLTTNKSFEKSVLFDMLGKEIKTFGSNTELDITTVASGIYTLRITTTDGMISTHRIVKN